MEPATKSRFAERSSPRGSIPISRTITAAAAIRVKGACKVMAHLMFGIVSITAMQIFRLLL